LASDLSQEPDHLSFSRFLNFIIKAHTLKQLMLECQRVLRQGTKKQMKKNTSLNGRGRSADLPTGLPESGIYGYVGEIV
jgi:hypothetical protein